MSRLRRINTIWRKELVDTLRDRRTVIAMVLVPMVLYPALMLGSLQALEVQVSFLVRQEYTIVVGDEATQLWLRHMIDRDPARRPEAESLPAEELVELSKPGIRAAPASQPAAAGDHTDPSRSGVRERPPPYRVILAKDVVQEVRDGRAHVGVLLEGEPPSAGSDRSASVQLIYDESDVRSTRFAMPGLRGVLERANRRLVTERLARLNLRPTLVRPLQVGEENIAGAERMAGAALGQIVPLILVLMTITGSIYPAIDLTAGERERGTLETLMVAPVATVELITGKFIVVTLIGLLSALLNLLSIGGTIYLGGLGNLLAQGGEFIFPLSALPWILLLLIPLAVMFSAVLLAVCSFARFKEAQNYIMPVMIAAMIPGVVGVLPGTRLEGPILVMPVANVVVLTRDLFLARADLNSIVLVLLSTSLYAGAAIAVAAKLFGQEAVLFADSGSIRTLFQRRFFKPRLAPSIAQALLLATVVYTLNFYVQQSILKSDWSRGPSYLYAVATTLFVLLVALPLVAAWYLRVRVSTALKLGPPSPLSLLAALCFGVSTWVLVKAWIVYQQRWMPLDPEMMRALEQQFGWLSETSPLSALILLAVVPAITEELFFRGFVLSGVRDSLNRWAAILIVALAFGLFHYSAMRLVATTALGALLAILVIQFNSIWPAMIAHLLHNGLATLTSSGMPLADFAQRIGVPAGLDAAPAPGTVLVAAALTAAGLVISLANRAAAADSALASRVPRVGKPEFVGR